MAGCNPFVGPDDKMEDDPAGVMSTIERARNRIAEAEKNGHKLGKGGRKDA